MGRKPLDIKGKRFGRLVAIEPTEKKSGSHIVWKCKCDCGNITYVNADSIKRGLTKSCGCIEKEARSTKNKILNHRTHKNNTSGRKGVSFSNQNQKWRTDICFNYKKYHLGYFEDINDAIHMRELAENAVKEDRFEDFIAELKG